MSMKKTIALSLFLLIFAGCSNAITSDSQNPIGLSEKVTLESVGTDNDTPPMAWKEAYAEFLRNFPGLTDNVVRCFSLRDLDDNGIPELIIIQGNGVANAVLTVYSYDGNVYKIGDYTDPKIGVSGLRISNNPIYPGLFTLWWGGGVEHYGYLKIGEGLLKHEDLWYMDRTKEPPQQNEISDDKQLINESIKAHPSYEYTDNLLNMHLINDDNINAIIG